MLPNKKKNSRRKPIVTVIVILLVLAVAVVGYVLINQSNQSATATQESSLKTSTVRLGSLIISATGSGVLVAGQSADLGFPVAGTVGELNVAVGDQVIQGQELAKLADLTSLQTAITTAELELASAQQALADLKGAATSNLANAELAVIKAGDALTSLQIGNSRSCSDYWVETYFTEWKDALAASDAAAADTALGYYQYCMDFTDEQLQTWQLDLTLAEQTLTSAQDNLTLLQQNSGIDPLAKWQAELKVSNAQAALDKANANLVNATLYAPFDGVVLSLAGTTGDSVGTGAFISIGDLMHPNITFTIDETDMDKAVVGNNVNITFDAITDQTFTGKVISVNPSLQSTGGYKVVVGVIQLDVDETNLKPFVNGLNASVEIIGGQADNVLLVPVEAVRDLGDGTFGVFVVGTDGEPRLKVVTVGLQDDTYAEIKTGLSEGDVVTTGLVETK